MAKRTYTLLEEAINRQAAFAADLQAGDELEYDFGDAEPAVLAAGWVERVDDDKKKKGGDK